MPSSEVSLVDPALPGLVGCVLCCPLLDSILARASCNELALTTRARSRFLRVQANATATAIAATTPPIIAMLIVCLTSASFTVTTEVVPPCTVVVVVMLAVAVVDLVSSLKFNVVVIDLPGASV